MMTVIRAGSIRAAFVALGLCSCAGLARAQAPAAAPTSTTAAAEAPTPAAIEAARQLIDLKGGSNIYNPIYIGVIQKAKYALLQTNPMLQTDLDAAAQKVAAELRPELDALKFYAARIYASSFTEKELKEALAFYKSPLGAKLIAIEPKVLDQSMRYADTWAAKLSEEAMVKLRDEMHKRGHDM